jgi:hypothetical protein
VIATLVDVGALWHTIWTAAASALLVAGVVGTAVWASARSHDLRAEGEPTMATLHAFVAAMFVLGALAIAGYGLYLVAT